MCFFRFLPLNQPLAYSGVTNAHHHTPPSLETRDGGGSSFPPPTTPMPPPSLETRDGGGFLLPCRCPPHPETTKRPQTCRLGLKCKFFFVFFCILSFLYSI